MILSKGSCFGKIKTNVFLFKKIKKLKKIKEIKTNVFLFKKIKKLKKIREDKDK